MTKLKQLWAEFKKFISRGNVVDMAVGVIIAGAFTAIVTAVTKGILMPLVNWAVRSATGGQGLEGLRTVLGQPVYVLDGEGVATSVIDWSNTLYIDWGTMINSIVDFLLIAVILFAILKIFVALRQVADGVSCDENKQRLKLIHAYKKQGMSFADAGKKADETIADMKKAAEEEKKAKEAENAKPTSEELLAQIRDLLADMKQQNIDDAENK